MIGDKQWTETILSQMGLNKYELKNRIKRLKERKLIDKIKREIKHELKINE